jgi:hypothetical protein
VRKNICLTVLFALFWGCASSGPMAPLDLSAPGWQVKQGQAIWKPETKKPEITGDIVLATNPNGTSYVQFSKTLPIVSAQTTSEGWAVEFPPENKHYSGRGNGPKKIVWLQLLKVIEGRELGEYWQLVHPSSDFVALENEESGERLEVHFQR